MTYYTGKNQRNSVWMGSCWALVALALTINQANAGVVSGSYQVSIAESERLLNALGTPEEAQVQIEESCDNPHLRVRARNKPAVLVTNDGTSQGDLTSFTLQINQLGFEFGSGDAATDGFTQFIKHSAYTDPGVTIDSSSVSMGGQLLTVNFSGLAPGLSAIFRIDLDPLDPNVFPFVDYREVLLGLDDQGQPGGGPPGETAATFSLGDMSTTTNSTPLPGAQSQAEFFNEQIRPYHAADPIIPVTSNGGTAPVPEPSTIFLLAVGGLGLMALRRKIASN